MCLAGKGFALRNKIGAGNAALLEFAHTPEDVMQKGETLPRVVDGPFAHTPEDVMQTARQVRTPFSNFQV